MLGDSLVFPTSALCPTSPLLLSLQIFLTRLSFEDTEQRGAAGQRGIKLRVRAAAATHLAKVRSFM